MANWLEFPVKGVLLDITGVLYESGEGYGTVISGSINAVDRLKAAGCPMRLVTNETTVSSNKLLEKLLHHGFPISSHEIFSPIPAMKLILSNDHLVPHILVHPNVISEFDGYIREEDPTCIILGDADYEFSFENMNRAFNALFQMQKPRLFSLGKGKYYRHKGKLQLDVGAFASALEYACDIEAKVIGKPSPDFFLAALKDMGVSPEEAVMVGDDINSDVGGAQKCGIRSVLVKTGKFSSNNLKHPTVKPDFIADNLEHAVNCLFAEKCIHN